MPIRLRISQTSLSPSRAPKSSTLPSLGNSPLETTFSRKDLPEPLAPSTAHFSPRRTVQLMFLSMGPFARITLTLLSRTMMSIDRSPLPYTPRGETLRPYQAGAIDAVIQAIFITFLRHPRRVVRLHLDLPGVMASALLHKLELRLLYPRRCRRQTRYFRDSHQVCH